MTKSDLKENWSYNEWPDVDIEGNVIKSKKLNESIEEKCDNRKLTETQKDNVVTYYVHYDDAGYPDFHGETAQELADQLGIDKMSVLNRIARHDPKYAKITWDETDPFFDGPAFERRSNRVKEDLTPAEQDEMRNIEGPAGVVRSKDRTRYSELRDFENDKSRKICGDEVCEEVMEEDLANAEICPKCGKVKVDGQEDFDGSKFTKCLKEAKEDKEDKDPVEDEEVADLKAQVRDALDACIPEDVEDFDTNDLIDAVLAYFDNKKAIEYIRSCICPEEEEEKVEEKPEEVSEEVVEEEAELEEDVASDLAAFEAGLN